MRRIGLASLVAVLAAACTSIPPPSSTTSAISTPRSTVAGPSPTPSVATAPPVLAADVAVSPDIQVVYANVEVGLSASAFVISDKSVATGPLEIATATIAFGDGASGTVRQSCGSPAERLRLHHVYRIAADYQVSVTSATLCQPGWQLNLDGGEGIRILPAAAPGTAAWPACTTYQLRMTGGGTGAGLGNVATLIHLTNVSASGCNLEGYPDVRLISSTGTLLPTHVQQAIDGTYMFAATAVGRVALAPGEAASLELGYTDTPFGSAADASYDVACPPARWLRVILPSNHQYGTASVATAPCAGRVEVSPIYPGSAWIGFP